MTDMTDRAPPRGHWSHCSYVRNGWACDCDRLALQTAAPVPPMTWRDDAALRAKLFAAPVPPPAAPTEPLAHGVSLSREDLAEIKRIVACYSPTETGLLNAVHLAYSTGISREFARHAAPTAAPPDTCTHGKTVEQECDLCEAEFINSGLRDMLLDTPAPAADALDSNDRDIIAALCSGAPEAEHEAIALHFLAAGAARVRAAVKAQIIAADAENERARQAAPAEVCPRCQHGVKHRTDEPHDAEMCDDIYIERTDEVLGLVEALDAINTLCGGHDEQSRAVQKIVADAIKEHAKWTQ